MASEAKAGGASASIAISARRLGEGAREVLEQAGAVPGVHLELDPVAGLVVAVPADVGEALGRLLQRGDVSAVGAVHGDAPAQRDVAHDLVTGDGTAALGQADGDVLHALDLDPEAGGLLDASPGGVAALDQSLGGQLVDRLAALQPLHDLGGDDLGRDLRLAQRDVEVVGLAEAHLADHVHEQW
jgi:hypothetical protein